MFGEKGLTLPIVLGVVLLVFFTLTFVIEINGYKSYYIDKQYAATVAAYAAEAGARHGIYKLLKNNANNISIDGSVDTANYRVIISAPTIDNPPRIIIQSIATFNNVSKKIEAIMVYSTQTGTYVLKSWKEI